MRALPPIRALPGKNVKILIRALPPIKALPGKTESLLVTNVHRQNDNENNKLLTNIMQPIITTKFGVEISHQML